MENTLVYLFLYPGANANTIAEYLQNVEMYPRAAAERLAERVAAKVAEILQKGITIRYNPFWGLWQAYHPDIPDMEDSSDLDYVIQFCLNL